MGPGAIFLLAAYLQIVLGLFFIRSPLIVAAIYIYFRVTFVAAAWIKVSVLGLPYAVPGIGLITIAAVYALARGKPAGHLSAVFKIYLCFLFAVAFAGI